MALKRNLFNKFTKNLIFIRRCSFEKNVIRSKAAKINLPENTLIFEHVWRNLDQWPTKIATECIETKRRYTYEELYRRSLGITKFLRESLNCKNHDCVGMILPNLPEFPIILLGILQAGMIVTTCNPNYKPEELSKQLKDSQSRAVFTTRELLPTVRQATGNLLPIIAVNHEQTSISSNGIIDFDEITRDFDSSYSHSVTGITPEDVAILPYSSGTTGLSKGVQLTHRNIIANLHQAASPEFRLIEESQGDFQDIVPALLPLFHIYGLVFLQLNSLSHGNKLVTIPKFSSNIFIKMLKEYKSTAVYATPPVVNMIINNNNIKTKDLESIRTIVSGAAPLGAADIERFHKKSEGKVNLIQAYGMTETSPLTHLQTSKLENGVQIGGCGFLMPNTDAKIVSVEDSTSTIGLGSHKTGELLIRGPQVMKGYFKNPKASNDVLLEGGWLKTGDIAYYDEFEHFYVTDRLKELIKVKGFQVAPAELEEILRHHPAIEDAAVIGIPHPKLGEAPKAFVVLKKDHNLSANKLNDYVAAKVVDYKQLVGGITFIDSIPKNASGKILRKELKTVV